MILILNFLQDLSLWSSTLRRCPPTKTWRPGAEKTFIMMKISNTISENNDERFILINSQSSQATTYWEPGVVNESVRTSPPDAHQSPEARDEHGDWYSQVVFFAQAFRKHCIVEICLFCNNRICPKVMLKLTTCFQWKKWGRRRERGTSTKGEFCSQQFFFSIILFKIHKQSHTYIQRWEEWALGEREAWAETGKSPKLGWKPSPWSYHMIIVIRSVWKP